MSYTALKQLWIEKGDIGLLWRGPSWIPWHARAAAFALRLIFPGAKPPLRGDSMYEWLVDAFEEMDKTHRAAGEPDSLMPYGHDLELFVPITDFHGYAREFPIDDPKVIRDTVHRHVLEFRYRKDGGASEDQFGSNHNNALAFAARATSSFPGAFPPMSLADAKRSGATVKVQPAPGAQASPYPKLFSAYEVYDASYEESVFVDGGVLDNYPFQSSIRAIGMRSASCEVDRRLLYIEPDPTPQKKPEPPSWMSTIITIWEKIMKPDPHDLQPSSKKPEPPSWMGTIWATLSAIPRSEPVIDDLIKLAERNENVARIRDIIETSFPGIEALVSRHLNATHRADRLPDSVEEVRVLRREIEDKAVEAAGFSAATYIRLRIRLLIDAYAGLVGDALEYVPKSDQSAFLGSVFRRWSRADQNETDATGMLFERSPKATPLQMEFLELFDLRYRNRQICFLIAAMSWWYRDIDQDGRTALDAAKEHLYEHIADLERILEDADKDPAIKKALDDINKAIKAALKPSSDKSDATAHARKEKVSGFVEHHKLKLDSLKDLLGEYIKKRLSELESHLYLGLKRIGAEWPKKVHGDLLVRYIGFPFWDMLLYPVQAVSNVGERDHVEVMRISPMDALLLTPMDGGKLKGVTLAHFSAFLEREYRENDYLWGRLDATERLITLLLDDPEEPGMKPADRTECAKAFKAIVDAEQGTLPTARDLIEHVRPQIEEIRRAGMVTDSTPSRPTRERT